MNQNPEQPPPDDQPELDALRRHLDALQRSVEQLGTEGAGSGPTAPPPAQAPAPDSPAHRHPSSEDPPQAAVEPRAGDPAHAQPPSPDPHSPGAGYPAHEPALPPAPEPGPAYEGSYSYAPQPSGYPPAPAATNGHREEDHQAASAVSAGLALLDAGPFADLIDLRHFEEAVTRLETVRDVRVRRYGHRRAQIEVGMAGPYAIARELQRLGRPIQVEQGPDGEVVVEFTDMEVPETGEAPPPGSARVDGVEEEAV